MDGEIVTRTPGERLHCKYHDRMFDVSVDLRVAAASEGALTTHVIEITPKGNAAKLMSPLVRLGVGKQTREAAANLKKYWNRRPHHSDAPLPGPLAESTISARLRFAAAPISHRSWSLGR